MTPKLPQLVERRDAIAFVIYKKGNTLTPITFDRLPSPGRSYARLIRRDLTYNFQSVETFIEKSMLGN